MIEIRFNDTWYEIPYDDETLGLNFTIDSAFDHGYFESTPLGASAGLDFSRRIPRDLLVRITIDNKVWYFKTGETYAEKNIVWNTVILA